jgi:Dolichyl-phosphate-mannose-protein mannosyltransferase
MTRSSPKPPRSFAGSVLATETQARPEVSSSRWRARVSSGSLDVPLVLAGAMLAAFVIRLVLAQRIVTPWIMVDELIYSELAKSFADKGDFLIRGATSGFRNVAYPAVIAPAWWTGSVESAYGVAKAINAALMVLAALPVYLWGRRLVGPGHALLATVLVLLMPSLMYSGMLMTENAFFVSFLTACFAIALTLERPTLPRQVLALAAIGVTFAVRPQGVVLLGVYVAAVALKLALDLRAPDLEHSLRHAGRWLVRFAPTAVIGLVLGAGYVLYSSLQGSGIESALGPYGGVLKVEYDLDYASDWILDHFAELAFSVALIPLSALIVLLGGAVRGRVTTEAERALLAVTVPAVVLVVIQVGIYASRFSLRIEERNMFCVAPLLFLVFALWLARGLPRPVVLTAAAAVASFALLLTLDLRSLLQIGVLSDTFALVPLYRATGQLDGGVDTVRLLFLGGGAAASLGFALLPRRAAAWILPTAVALFLGVWSASVFVTIRDHSWATLALTDPGNPSWVDETIGDDGNAAFVFGTSVDPYGEAQIMWQTEFWNRSVGPVYAVGFPDPASLAGAAASTFDPLTGRIVTTDPNAARIRHAVVPATAQLAGTNIAQAGRLALYRIDRPLRFAVHLGGVYADSWMGDFAALTHYATPSSRGRLHVRVSREGWGRPSPPGDVTLTVGPLVDAGGQPAVGKPASSRTWRVRSGQARSFFLPTPKVPYRLEVRVTPTFSPADYGEADPRRLGAQLHVASL